MRTHRPRSHTRRSSTVVPSASNQCPVRAALLGFQNARIDVILAAGERGAWMEARDEGHGHLVEGWTLLHSPSTLDGISFTVQSQGHPGR